MSLNRTFYDLREWIIYTLVMLHDWKDHIFNPIEQFIADIKNGKKFKPEQDGYILFRDGKLLSPVAMPQTNNKKR